MRTPFKKSNRKLICGLLLCLFSIAPVHAQSTPSQTAHIDPDWEKIRDAQVQMLKKKEQELDKLKEELLSRAQPQTASVSEELRIEMQAKEKAWGDQLKKYENEISLLRIKVEDQKKELDELRGHAEPQAKAEARDSAADGKEPEEELHALKQKEEEFKTLKAQLDEREQNLSKLQLDLENQRKVFEAQMKQDQERLQNEKSGFEREKQALLDQAQMVSRKSEELEKNLQKLGDAAGREKVIADREAELTAKEQNLQARIFEVSDREARIAESQKQLVEDRRQWQIEKNQLAVDLENKFDEVQSRLAKADSIDAERDRLRIAYEKQLEEVRNELNFTKDQYAQREMELRERIQELTAVQSKQTQEIADLEAALSAQAKKVLENADFEKTISELTQQMTDLKNKNGELESEILRLRAQSRPDEDYEASVKQLQGEIESQKRDLSQKDGELENLENERSRLEQELVQLREQMPQNLESQADLDLNRVTELESALQDLRDENEALRAAAAMPAQNLSTESSDLERELESLRIENEDWRRNYAQTEQKWSEFVSRETQYQMEITALKKQLAENSVSESGRDWNAEARRVIEERRALSEEKAQMYRQLTQERQKMDQERVELMRRQREFEAYVNQEKVRLERLRRQVA